LSGGFLGYGIYPCSYLVISALFDDVTGVRKQLNVTVVANLVGETWTSHTKQKHIIINILQLKHPSCKINVGCITINITMLDKKIKAILLIQQ